MAGGVVSPEDAAIDKEEDAVLYLLNEYRAERGLSQLGFHRAANLAAAFHARDMALRGYFSHDAPERRWFQRMTDFGVPMTAGENIAAGYADAAAVFEGWRTSPTHDRNQLRPEWRSCGIAVVYAGGWGTYWVIDFTVAPPDYPGGEIDPPEPPPPPPPPPPPVVPNVFVEYWTGATGGWTVKPIDLPDPPAGGRAFYIVKALRNGRIDMITDFVQVEGG
jgi:hypothetical protein